MEESTLEKYSENLKQEGYCNIAFNIDEMQLYAYSPLKKDVSFRKKTVFHKPLIKKYNFNFANNYKYVDFKLDKSRFEEIYSDFNNLPKHLKRNFKKHLRLFIKRYSILDKEELRKSLKAL